MDEGLKQTGKAPRTDQGAKLSANKNKTIKGQVQGLGWFLTRFPLKFAENNDVGEIVIWGL